MEQPLLKDPEIEPSEEVLRREFGDWYPVYEAFLSRIQSDDFAAEWRYYKDGKAWLCKISHKRKTVVWLSAWKDYFKLGFYFTEKTGAGINDLDIDQDLKQNYAEAKPVGKLKPLVANVNRLSQLPDIYSLLSYKAGL